MIEVSVQVDIEQAIRMLNLLPREAERAAYRAINKIADEIKSDSAKEISRETGISVTKVKDRMYVRGANAGRLIAVVAALPSAKNVGYYDGANVRPGEWFGSKGVEIKAWGRRDFYDKVFVKGPQKRISSKRRIWRRVGPGKDDITDKVWGPSVRKSFTRPALQARQMDILRKRWPRWFEYYLRGELVKLRGAESLRGVTNVMPSLEGPLISGS